MSRPVDLVLYAWGTQIVEPLAYPLLAWRARRGKEDPARLNERMGRPTVTRPAGPLIWLHGASVGETRVLMQIQQGLAASRSDLAFLFTSGTPTSAALLADPPKRALHQFVPIDCSGAARRFISHWRPEVAIFAESDLWPNLIEEAAEGGAALALVNARMSPKSLASWARRSNAARHLLNRFAVILAADLRTGEALSELSGRAVDTVGNLKFAAEPAPADPAALAALRAAIGGRPVWLAASTHPGEDEIVLAAHERVRAACGDALLLIAPRHPQRGPAIAALAGDAPLRSAGALPDARPVYVADTMGELPTFYAVAPVSLVAGSLLAKLRGHNPIEPAKVGSAILAGPHVDSFREIYSALLDAGAVVQVSGSRDLAEAVATLIREPQRRQRLMRAARAHVERGSNAVAATLAALAPLLPPRSAHAAA